jgi:hypothetical protein
MHKADRRHLDVCFRPRGYPQGREGDFWELPNIKWEVNDRYEGEWAYLDPHALYEVLVQPVHTQCDWVRRHGAVALIWEQLVMLESYGSCSLNVQELYVPADVGNRLEQLTKARQPDNAVPGSRSRPPGGYPRSPKTFPMDIRTVTSGSVAHFAGVKGSQKQVMLYDLARKMRQRWDSRPPVQFVLPLAADNSDTREEPEEEEVPRRSVMVSAINGKDRKPPGLLVGTVA